MAFDSNTYKTFVVKHYTDLFNEQLYSKLQDEEKQFIYSVLSRFEETSSGHTDSFGNYEFQFSQFNVNEPYLDYYCIDLLKKHGLEKRVLWAENPFAVILSHDVDLVNKNHFRQDFRAAIKHLLKGKGLSKINAVLHFALIFRNILFRIKRGGDTLWDYEQWIDMEKKHGFTSTYFLFVRTVLKDLHVYDCDFLLNDSFKFRGRFITVRDYLKILDDEGFEVGLHGAYNAFNSDQIYTAQLSTLLQVVEQPINAHRNHYLHFDAIQTPLALSKTEIEVDSTLGFNKHVGFRAGTCMPFYFYREGMPKPILEVPLIIMDSSLFMNFAMELNLDLAKEKCKSIIKHVESVGGVLTINFHPDKLSKPYYKEMYEYLLAELSRSAVRCLNYDELKGVVNRTLKHQ